MRTPQISNIARFVNTNVRARELYDLFTDAVFLGQVPSVDAAIAYAKEVTAITRSPIYIGNVTREEALPIFNYAVKSRRG